jgi:hypothetical protein
MEKYLLEGINSRSITRAALGYLQRSLAALQASDIGSMLELAQAARQVARKCDDRLGEAAALLHCGTACARQNELDHARRVFELAQREYARIPSWPARHYEAIAHYCIGLLFQRGSRPSSVDAVASFQKALNLLEDVKFFYAAGGDDRQLNLVHELCEELRVRIRDQSSSTAIETGPFEITVGTGWQELEPGDSVAPTTPLLPARSRDSENQ